MGSTRLPEKVLKPVAAGQTLIELMLGRLHNLNTLQSKFEFDVVTIVPDSESNLPLIERIAQSKFNLYRGSEYDLLSRHYHCARHMKADNIIKIPSDCPLICVDVILQAVEVFAEHNLDFVSNLNPATLADGMDVEIMSFRALEDAYLNATLQIEREHTTPYIAKNTLKKAAIRLKDDYDYKSIRLVVDYAEDLTNIREILKAVGEAPVQYMDLISNIRKIGVDNLQNKALRGNSWMLRSNYTPDEFAKVFYYEL